nr:MAG TPA: hypothetical protein [Caudoviricetes sp.]
MVVNSKEQAWIEVNKIFPTDYEKDESSSQRAGYDIYRHPTLNYYSRICDLGDRLEVLTGEYGENVTNIWIEEPKAPVTFKVIVTYQVHDGSVMTKEMTDVRGVETVWEKIGGEKVQIFKVNQGSYKGASWAAGAILNVNMILERK